MPEPHLFAQQRVMLAGELYLCWDTIGKASLSYTGSLLFSLTAFLLNEVMAWIWWSHCQSAGFAQDKRGKGVGKEPEERVECLGVRSPHLLGGLLLEEGASLLSPGEWCLCLYRCETTGFHSFLLGY